MDSGPTDKTSIESLAKVILKLMDTSATEDDCLYLLNRIIAYQLHKYSGNDAALFRLSRHIVKLVVETDSKYSREVASSPFPPFHIN